MKHKWLLAGATLIFAAGSAMADTVYTSQSSFNAAVPGATTYGFPAVAGSQDVGTSYTVGPVTFNGADLNLFNDGDYGAGQTYLGMFDVAPSASIPGGTNAIGFTIGSFLGNESSQIFVNGALVDTIGVPGRPDSTFFGYVSDTPITSVGFVQSIQVEGTELDVLNFEVGSTAATPEPSSLALLGSALLGGAAALRRRVVRA